METRRLILVGILGAVILFVLLALIIQSSGNVIL